MVYNNMNIIHMYMSSKLIKLYKATMNYQLYIGVAYSTQELMHLTLDASISCCAPHDTWAQKSKTSLVAG